MDKIQILEEELKLSGKTMQTVTIRALTPETEEICAIRLVGGFDSERKHYPALNIFRFDNKRHLELLADYAEAGCPESIDLIERLIIGELIHAKDLVFDGIRFVFDVQSFTEPRSLRWLAWEVLAQIIEE
ncbi:hypothetical protein [Pseudomonas plecoglossicida]|uniref:hypothetical protein n=1 Tax=Pseudomonas plecoglossicida TaxID=70775 RepID=UPI001269DAE5|nr:hypothetical protein [Pseudomonas plecoglossicida]